MEKIIKLLEENARYTNEEIAVMLGRTEDDVTKSIEKMEKEGIICGYKAVINREKLNTNEVTAFIELKVVPKPDLGFEEVAQTIAGFTEVHEVYLMSGGYDLAIILKGTNFKDVALFVAQRLAMLDSIVSTATHFVLTPYKQGGFIMNDDESVERRMTVL